MRKRRDTRLMAGRVGRGHLPAIASSHGSDLKFAPREFEETRLTSDELDLSVQPCESEFGEAAYSEIVFDDGTYNSLCMAIHGQRLWDSAEEQEVE